MPKARRILLKLSGEALQGSLSSGIDFSILKNLASQIIAAKKSGYQIAVVIGAGNIWRFRDHQDSGIDRVYSDYMGMLATIMNSVALMSAIENGGVPARVCSALDIPSVAEPYIKRRATRHLEKGRVVICAGGTGNPYFTTDSAAALRSLELECDLLVKATNTDAVYSDDPKKNKKARRYSKISYDEVLEKDLKVMDGAAIALCRDGHIPIQVFRFGKKEDLINALEGKIGTRIA